MRYYLPSSDLFTNLNNNYLSPTILLAFIVTQTNKRKEQFEEMK